MTVHHGNNTHKHILHMKDDIGDILCAEDCDCEKFWDAS